MCLDIAMETPAAFDGICARGRTIAWLAVMLVLVWAMWLPTLHAAGLHKCLLPGGNHLYANGGCPTGSREIWQRQTEPDPAQEASVLRRWKDIEAWQDGNRRKASARARQAVGTRRTATRNAEAAASGCERARQRRERIRDRDWMRMTYDRMVRLDQDVRDACR